MDFLRNLTGASVRPSHSEKTGLLQAHQHGVESLCALFGKEGVSLSASTWGGIDTQSVARVKALLARVEQQQWSPNEREAAVSALQRYAAELGAAYNACTFPHGDSASILSAIGDAALTLHRLGAQDHPRIAQPHSQPTAPSVPPKADAGAPPIEMAQDQARQRLGNKYAENRRPRAHGEWSNHLAALLGKGPSSVEVKRADALELSNASIDRICDLIDQAGEVVADVGPNARKIAETFLGYEAELEDLAALGQACPKSEEKVLQALKQAMNRADFAIAPKKGSLDDWYVKGRLDHTKIAAGLGLSEDKIGFDRHGALRVCIEDLPRIAAKPAGRPSQQQGPSVYRDLLSHLREAAGEKVVDHEKRKGEKTKHAGERVEDYRRNYQADAKALDRPAQTFHPGTVCAHGTNALGALLALCDSNGQIVPGDKMRKVFGESLTVESKTTPPWSNKLVSAVGASNMKLRDFDVAVSNSEMAARQGGGSQDLAATDETLRAAYRTLSETPVVVIGSGRMTVKAVKGKFPGLGLTAFAGRSIDDGEAAFQRIDIRALTVSDDWSRESLVLALDSLGLNHIPVFLHETCKDKNVMDMFQGKPSLPEFVAAQIHWDEEKDEFSMMPARVTLDAL